MKSAHNNLKDLLPTAKCIPSYKVKAHDKRIVGATVARFSNFKRLGLSPAQPHSKNYGR